ncbi:MAG: hypothetical protein ABR591_12125, partial [Candidatus Velthaea sp.]
MHRTALLALTALVTLSACSTGAPSAGAPPANDALRSSSMVKAAPYQVPIVTSPAVQDAERRAKAQTRWRKNSYGGTPTFSASADFTDAPNFGPGSQINLAIAGVQAVSAGTNYPLVSYDAPVIINVLDYQHTALSLGSNLIPAISYDGLILSIDPSKSTVVTNGQTYPMQFGSFDRRSHAFSPSPSGIQNVFFALPFDGSSGDGHLMIDFAAIDSIALVNGVAEVGPMLRGAKVSNSAVIAGTLVSNAGAAVANATVEAIAADVGTTASTVSRWLAAYGIPRRGHRPGVDNLLYEESLTA